MQMIFANAHLRTAVICAKKFRDCTVTIYTDKTLNRYLHPQNLFILNRTPDPDIHSPITLKNDENIVVYNGFAMYRGGRSALLNHLAELIYFERLQTEGNKENEEPSTEN